MHMHPSYGLLSNCAEFGKTRGQETRMTYPDNPTRTKSSILVQWETAICSGNRAGQPPKPRVQHHLKVGLNDQCYEFTRIQHRVRFVHLCKASIISLTGAPVELDHRLNDLLPRCVLHTFLPLLISQTNVKCCLL